MKRYTVLMLISILICTNLLSLTGYSDSSADATLDSTVSPLDAPIVTIEIITIQGVDNVHIAWGAVQGATHYKVYTAQQPTLPFPEWGDPITITSELFYNAPTFEGDRMFYRVVAVDNQ